MLAELIAGPAPIRTQYETRWNDELWRTEVQCPGCKSWGPLTRTAHCHFCVIDLVARPEQPELAIVAEPVAEQEEALSLDFELDLDKEYLSPMDVCMMTQEQLAAWSAKHVPPLPTEDAVQAAYVPPAPTASKATPCETPDTTPDLVELATARAAQLRTEMVQTVPDEQALPSWTQPDEQDTLIAELALEDDAQPDRERYFAARSGKYVLLHMRESGMAVNCSCPSRVKKLRYHGVACKHMTAHNNMLTPAARKQEAA